MKRGSLAIFMEALATQEDAPYLYGGCGEDWLSDGRWRASPYFGFDCWKLIAWALEKSGGPSWRSWWTDRAWAELQPVAAPSPGVVAFWLSAKPKGENDVEHAEVVVGPGNPIHLANGGKLHGLRTIGASGGTALTKTLVMAQSQGARVKYRANHLERPRFAGFRKLPLDV